MKASWSARRTRRTASYGPGRSHALAAPLGVDHFVRRHLGCTADGRPPVFVRVALEFSGGLAIQDPAGDSNRVGHGRLWRVVPRGLDLRYPGHRVSHSRPAIGPALGLADRLMPGRARFDRSNDFWVEPLAASN